MAEQRLIDANKISPVDIQYYGKVVDWTTIEHAYKIDPETLPIVQQLREELAKVTAERDAAVEQLHGKCYACKHNNTPFHSSGKCEECKYRYYQFEMVNNPDNWEFCGLQKEE